MWFLTALRMSEETYDSGNFVTSKCPTCKRDVRSRPVPIFLVKAIAEIVLSYWRDRDEGGGIVSPLPGGDPWVDIFLPSDDEGPGDDEESSDDEGEDKEGEDGDGELYYSPTFFRVAGSRYRVV